MGKYTNRNSQKIVNFEVKNQKCLECGHIFTYKNYFYPLKCVPIVRCPNCNFWVRCYNNWNPEYQKYFDVKHLVNKYSYHGRIRKVIKDLGIILVKKRKIINNKEQNVYEIL